MPPLSLLRTFEVAARHQSFRRAAQELHLTPAAVSQQMRQLEALLGVALFVRRARGVALTDRGQAYFEDIAAALLRVGEATHRLREPERAGLLTISVAPAFAQFWLLPRLPSFRSRHPEIQLRIRAETRLVDLRHGEADLAIRFGPGRYEGVRAELLMDDLVFPACAPRLLAGTATPYRITDLLGFPLLHDDGVGPEEPRLAWRYWLARESVAGERVAGLHLPDAGLVLQAALLGQGVALVRRSLAAESIGEGRLVRLLDRTFPTEYAHWLLVAPARTEDPRIQAFSAWVREQAGASR